jgi:hypothetical protein
MNMEGTNKEMKPEKSQSNWWMIPIGLVLLVGVYFLGSCNAPGAEPREIEVTRIVAGEPVIETVVETVEVEVPGEIIIVEKVVTPTLEPAPPASEKQWGILYVQTKNYTELVKLVGENADGDLLFAKANVAFAADQTILTYNGRGEGEEAEFYIVDDYLAIAEASFPNAQQFVCVDEGEAQYVYPDPQSICEDGQEQTALSPGRWVGKMLNSDGDERPGDVFLYKVAGPAGPGLYVRVDHVFRLSCDTAFDIDGNEFMVDFKYLSNWDSCQQ